MKYSAFICGIILVVSTQTQARFDFEYSRNGSGATYSNNTSLGWSLDTFVDEKTENVGLNHYFGYSYANANTVASLVSSSPDYEISSNSHELSYSLTYAEALTLSLSGGFTNYNENESRAETSGIALYYQFSNFQIGAGFGRTDYYQVKPVILTLGNTDVTDRLRFRQLMSNFYIDWQVSESFLMKINSAYYKYEIPNAPNISSLDQFSSFLTSSVTNVISQAGGSLASEVQSQAAATTDISFLYNFNENWLFELSLGNSRDFLTPQINTNSLGIGLEYSGQVYDSGQLRLFMSITGSKTQDIEQNSFSGMAGVGISF